MRTWPARSWLLLLAGLCAGGFALTYWLAFGTSLGARADEAVFVRVRGAPAALAARAGTSAVRTIDVGSLALGAIALAALALVRGRVRRAGGAVVLVGGAVGTAELAKSRLGRHDPFGARDARGSFFATFPSGHATIAAALGLALVLAAPGVLRLAAALCGAIYAAGVGTALVALGWHRPSDVVGGFLVAGAWAAVVALACSPRRSALAPKAVAAAAAAAVLAVAVAVVLLRRHPTFASNLSAAPSVVAAALALGVLALALALAYAALVEDEAR